MTIHEKYGLKTDVKSVKERLFGGHFSYARFLIGYIEKHEGISEYDSVTAVDFCGRWSEIKDADLALLCSLAEKGERYEKAVKALWAQEVIKHGKVDSFIENWEKSLHSAKIEACVQIITEAEGE